MYSTKHIIVSYSVYKSLTNEAGCGEFVGPEIIDCLLYTSDAADE